MANWLKTINIKPILDKDGNELESQANKALEKLYDWADCNLVWLG